MSIFNIHLVEHALNVGRSLSNAADAGQQIKVAAKVKPPMKTGLTTYGGKPPAPKPKPPAPKPKPPVSKPKPPVSKPKVSAPEAPVPKVSALEAPTPKVIDDLKVFSKSIDTQVKTTVNDLTKASNNFKNTTKENMFKFKDELDEPLKSVYKQIDEGGSAIPRNADGPVVKGKVEADEIASNLKKLDENAPKDIDDATDKIKKISDDRGKELGAKVESDTFKKNKKAWANEHKLLVGAVGVSAIIAGGMAIAAAVKEKEKEDKEYNIVSIDDISTSSLPLAKITFTPGEKISNRDYLIFNGTDCDPPLPPNCEIYKIDSDFQVQVIIPEKLKSNGKTGKMKINTSFSNQFSLLITDTTKDLANIVGQTAGAITQGTADVTKEVAKSFWEGLGLPDLTEYWWVLLIVCILLLFSSSSLVALQLSRT